MMTVDQMWIQIEKQTIAIRVRQGGEATDCQGAEYVVQRGREIQSLCLMEQGMDTGESQPFPTTQQGFVTKDAAGVDIDDGLQGIGQGVASLSNERFGIIELGWVWCVHDSRQLWSFIG
jgi:hypothetical protein